MNARWIIPDWPAPANVKSVSTARVGGVSQPPFDSLNLGIRSGDGREAVTENRARLKSALNLASEPYWLRQVHSSRVIDAAEHEPDVEADASFATQSGLGCAVLTADCLPVLMTDREGTIVAAAHGGWRGLAAGVLENTVRAMDRPPNRLLAWFGPAIGPEVFEVGEEVRSHFVEGLAETAHAFKPSPDGRWLADIYALARLHLRSAGVKEIYGGGLCTVSDPKRFYSYRRDGETGRMATLIWLSA